MAGPRAEVGKVMSGRGGWEKGKQLVFCQPIPRASEVWLGSAAGSRVGPCGRLEGCSQRMTGAEIKEQC